MTRVENIHQRLVAYHEAGHAVYALPKKRSIGRVSIMTPGEPTGFCLLHKPRWNPSKTSKLYREIRLLLAGGVAEVLACPGRVLPKELAALAPPL